MKYEVEFKKSRNFQHFKRLMKKYKIKFKSVQSNYYRLKKKFKDESKIQYNNLIIKEVLDDEYKKYDNFLGMLSYINFIKFKDMVRLKQEITENLLRKEGFSYEEREFLKDKGFVK